MKLHKRTLIVNKADGDLSTLLGNWEAKHNLTCVEIVVILTERVAERAARYMKYVLRKERHPKGDKRADEE